MADTPAERALREALEFAAAHLSSDWPERCQEIVRRARAALADTPAPLVSGGSLVALADTTKAGCASSDGIDARRYRWLRAGRRTRQGVVVENAGTRMIDKDERSFLMAFHFWCSEGDLDAAIDAAIDQAEGVR